MPLLRIHIAITRAKSIIREFYVDRLRILATIIQVSNPKRRKHLLVHIILVPVGAHRFPELAGDIDDENWRLICKVCFSARNFVFALIT